MQLPPPQQNEPEWLQVQRRRKQEARINGAGTWSALLTFPLLHFLLQSVIGFEHLQQLAPWIGIAGAMLAIALFQGSIQKSARRSFAIWIGVLFGVEALIGVTTLIGS